MKAVRTVKTKEAGRPLLCFATFQLVVGWLVSRFSVHSIIPALPTHLLQRLRTLLGRHAVVVALGHDAGHVVHGVGNHGLDALVGRHGVQCHTAPAADADHADTLAINVGLQADKVHCSHEVLGVDVWRGDVARLAAAFPGIGAIECQRDKAALGHRLRIEARCLFLYRAEWAADHDGRQLLIPTVLWQIHIGGEGDAVAIFERDFLMIDLVAAWESLVPLLNQTHRISAGCNGVCLGERGLCVGKHRGTGHDGALNQIPAGKSAVHVNLVVQNESWVSTGRSSKWQSPLPACRCGRCRNRGR